MRLLIKPTFTNADNWLQINGPKVWAAICDNMPIDKWFSLDDVVPIVRKVFPITSERQARVYARTVLNNVHAENNGVVRRAGHQYMI